MLEVRGVDGAGIVDGGGGERVVGDAVDEPWQPARALEQRLDGGGLEQGASVRFFGRRFYVGALFLVVSALAVAVACGCRRSRGGGGSRRRR